MSRPRNGIVSLLLLACIPWSVGIGGARADTLHAQVPKRSFLLYEPVAIHVDLRFDEPVIVNFAEDPDEAERQLRRIPQRLNVKLRDEQGAKVSESMLFGAEIARPERGHPAREFSACGLAFFEVLKIAKGATWDLAPGLYTIVVSGGRLESNAIAVELVAPEGKELEAAEIFRASLPVGALVILEQKRDDPTLRRFEELARDYAATVYGEYAMVSLALLRYADAREQHNSKGGSTVWGPVSEKLAAATGHFTGKHPLREKLLFDLAVARALNGDYGGARESIVILKASFPGGELAMRSTGLEKELSEIEDKKGSTQQEAE